MKSIWASPSLTPRIYALFSPQQIFSDLLTKRAYFEFETGAESLDFVGCHASEALVERVAGFQLLAVDE